VTDHGVAQEDTGDRGKMEKLSFGRKKTAVQWKNSRANE